jgi:cytochrome bd-type quinol oxidase subunit 1
MNYPVWELTTFGGGVLIAVIATVHVFVSHFAVGGGLFLVLTEMKGYRERDKRILDYVKGHTKFFLLLTMVFGALTGFGIWLIIALLSPAATSVLIHSFVFGWATEWVFFVVEIASLLIYYYTFYRMEPQNHLIVGWIYFIFAWLSLFVINGIVSFMLTPGHWIETRSFWDGFFNPSFGPSLFFRTFIALSLAGIYGLITSTRIQEDALRQRMVRYCGLWLALPFVLLVPSAWWYLQVIPPEARVVISDPDLTVNTVRKAFLVLTPILFLLGLLMALRLPKSFQQGFSFVLMALAFLYLGSFEMVRESARRPYIIHGYMYSNSILKDSLSEIQKQGVLKTARWAKNKSLSSANELAAGEEVFKLLCISCHSVGGYRNDILERTSGMKVVEFESVLDEMGDEEEQMPPFAGNQQERQALTKYVLEKLRGKQ